MHETNLAAVDLNLLVALDALLEERSVTRAAQRLGLSQPATSHALARLRELTGDALLVRSGARLVRTPRAEALQPAVRAILDDVRRALEGDHFEPASARRAFTIASADYGELVLVPPLLRILAREAPGVDLVVRPVPEEPAEALAAGRVDLVLGVEPGRGAPGSLERRKLFDDGFVCLVRRDHPVLERELTVERFAAMGHLFIAPRGTRGGVVDDALGRRGLERRVVAMVPSFVAAPALVAESDLVVTLPSLLAARLAGPFGLRALEAPVRLPRFTISALWHARSRRDPAHAWLRATLVRAAGQVAARGSSRATRA